MSDPRRALVLHLVGREPLLIAVSSDTVQELADGLVERLRKADVEVITAANGSSVVVNFAHVVAAHVETVSGMAQLYGSPQRER